MKKEELLVLLKDLGFTEYEAKAYLALLKGSPVTAYAVARDSGVPRSKVYGVLEGMVGRGVAFVSHGEPASYAPLPPRELVRDRRREAEGVLSAAEEGLEGWAKREGSAPGDERIWDIKGRREILSRLRELVGRAEERVLLQIWGEDAPELAAELEAASDRGVEITVVAYGDPGYPFAGVYLHDPGPEIITPEYGGRWIILCVDAKEVVAGIVFPEDLARAAWSAHPGIVMPITEQVKHDLYVAEMLTSHREALEEEYGPSLERLRAKFGPPTTAPRVTPRAFPGRAEGRG
jgi:sugar-specific transcriptional regulator TrmB